MGILFFAGYHVESYINVNEKQYDNKSYDYFLQVIIYITKLQSKFLFGSDARHKFKFKFHATKTKDLTGSY